MYSLFTNVYINKYPVNNLIAFKLVFSSECNIQSPIGIYA